MSYWSDMAARIDVLLLPTLPAGWTEEVRADLRQAVRSELVAAPAEMTDEEKKAFGKRVRAAIKGWATRNAQRGVRREGDLLRDALRAVGSALGEGGAAFLRGLTSDWGILLLLALGVWVASEGGK